MTDMSNNDLDISIQVDLDERNVYTNLPVNLANLYLMLMELYQDNEVYEEDFPLEVVPSYHEKDKFYISIVAGWDIIEA